MKFIITVGREYGSGGRFIAKKVAEKMGIKFYDNELLVEAAKKSGLSEAVFKAYDEKKDSFFGSAVGMYSYDMSLGQKVFLAQFDAIKKIADEPESCVIVGRCADYVLRDRKDVVNIFICAPFDERCYRAITYYHIPSNKVNSHVRKMDKKRKAYYNFYTDEREWGKADNYDLCINSKVGVDQCVDAIIRYTKARFAIDEYALPENACNVNIRTDEDK
jgi:cytidylate kinase